MHNGILFVITLKKLTKNVWRYQKIPLTLHRFKKNVYLMMTRYYYIIDNKEFGPVDYDGLKALNLPENIIVRLESSDFETTVSEILKSQPSNDNITCVKVSQESHSNFHFFTKEK